MNERVPGADPWPVTSADRAALLRKYRMLAQSRHAKDTAVDPTGADTGVQTGASDATVLRALSQEFPGALRELDVLGLPEILRRIACLADGRDRRQGPGATDDWLPWILAYHALMRAALVAKRASGRDRRIRGAAMPDIIRTASAAAGCAVDEAFLHAIVHPPGGRMGVVVFGELARRFDVPAIRISTTLFPPRRPAPYLLPG